MTLKTLPAAIETEENSLSDLNSAEYAYERLPSDGEFIRLLEILPGDSLRVRLRCAELTPNTDYDALSYTWGAPLNGCKIECDGGAISIGRNLFGALSRLQLHSQERVVWADALCINQNDHEERAQQVRLMHKIYEQANSVIVDFGNDKKNLATEAFRMIRETLDYYEPHMQKPAREYKVDILPEDMTEASDRVCYVIRHLYFEQEWWYRAWVQQEIGLARTAIVHWGSERLLWSDLVGFAMIKLIVGYSSPRIPLVVRYLSQLHTNFKAWVSFDSTQSWIHEKPYLREVLTPETRLNSSTGAIARVATHLLEHSRDLRASTPSDHIYAFIGHPAMQRFLSFDTECLVTVDYNILAEDLFVSLAKVFISATTSLDILSSVQDGQKDDLLPSWVPNWSRQRLGRLTSMSSDFYGTRFQSFWDASRRKDHHSRLTANLGIEIPLILSGDQILEASGLSVDVIAYTTSFHSIDEFLADPTSKSSGGLPNPVEEFWWGMKPSLSELPSPYDDQWKAFVCTLSMGRSFDGHMLEMAWQSEAGHVQSFVEERCRFRPEEILELFGTSPPATGDWKRFTVQMRYSHGRRLFVTAGGYMGVGSPDIMAGDNVCVLFDASVPFILHPTLGTVQAPAVTRYKLHGECYVHGLMQGEAIDMWEAGQLSAQRFSII